MSPSTIDMTQTAPPVDPFDLDISIVESGDAVNVLLGNTDDGCDTQKQGDC
jgi:FxLD family lantipeptide